MASGQEGLVVGIFCHLFNNQLRDSGRPDRNERRSAVMSDKSRKSSFRIAVAGF